ncbi:hypothetical protein CEXT_636641 [Caerostris extrusa]|uniref:Uncharacterized protein n=1 Tax=Caerostris extrusa TaxID=172846 RepID=A0AAV4QDB1_CAEEX|nr:hypothetical protein CEXT_636641 [Caerostris extrusa]
MIFPHPPQVIQRHCDLFFPDKVNTADTLRRTPVGCAFRQQFFSRLFLNGDARQAHTPSVRPLGFINKEGPERKEGSIVFANTIFVATGKLRLSCSDGITGNVNFWHRQ